ncbi:hypothetical protein [Butyrivibrio sp. YAB3001]|uniref:hypothetical protein n=1 Tax=Butyrivibrio sp. YAB3001 TaxID=1520812 RepID=UPI0008F65E4A|nr:hypothetical protein [Butyrivibrio sp. YAB3001]SFC53286.1 hypothetical protein SAMN02910398_02466 [Butyrivibrio sp. YAB3001]
MNMEKSLDPEQTTGKFIIPTQSYRVDGASYYYAPASDYFDTCHTWDAGYDIATDPQCLDKNIRKELEIAQRTWEKGIIQPLFKYDWIIRDDM